MSNRKKRPYNSTSRNAQAAETRSRILESARRLFLKEGYESVTIEQIAKAANVSAPTIYALFQSKRGIIRALLDEALPNDQREALVEKIEDKPAKERLIIAAKVSRQMYDAEKAEMDIFRGASVLSPELKELEKEREERRYKRQEGSFKKLADEKGLNVSKKTKDILWAFTGRDLYRLLVIERGWTSDEYERWLAEHLIKNLLSDV